MILIVILAVPLLAALISCLPLGRRLAPAVTLTSCALELAMVIAAAMRVAAGGSVVAIANWVDIDGLSALILLLVATVGSTAALFSWGYMAREPSARRLRRYYSNYNLFVFAMLSVPMLAEPNLVWTGVELTTILSLYLVAFENTHEALEAAWKYSVLTIMGGAVALLGSNWRREFRQPYLRPGSCQSS